MDEQLSKRTEDLRGRVFTYLTVSEFAGYRDMGNSGRKAVWKCNCKCGNIVNVPANALKTGNTKSCGCFNLEAINNRNIVHNMHGNTVYNSWRAIKGRCYDPNNISYKNYGAKGIVMDEKFRDSFVAFLEEVGFPPESTGYSIDRINRKIGYVEGNMRWATRKQQARNKGKSVRCKTGVMGVHRATFANGYEYYVASWSNPTTGARIVKLFSILKLGEDAALAHATEYRLEKLQELKSMDCGYCHDYGE